MELSRDRGIKDNVYSIDIKFFKYGRPNLTPEKEKELLENYTSQISYRNIKFEGYYKINEYGNIVETDPPTTKEQETQGDDGQPIKTTVEVPSDGELVKITLNDRDLKLDENFEAYYEINVDKVNHSEIGTILKDKYLVAEAKCLLFLDRVSEAIESEIDSVVARNNEFEGSDNITL